ncbi:hypothetical protein MY10362_009443, partial [Beauveria mimosiformis]
MAEISSQRCFPPPPPPPPFRNPRSPSSPGYASARQAMKAAGMRLLAALRAVSAARRHLLSVVGGEDLRVLTAATLALNVAIRSSRHAHFEPDDLLG